MPKKGPANADPNIRDLIKNFIECEVI